MSAVFDTVQLEVQEYLLFRKRFPRAVFMKVKAEHSRYRVIISDETEEDYYLFLVDNCLALCSANFLGRVEHDEMFARRMRNRLARNLKALQRGTVKKRREAGEVGEVVNLGAEPDGMTKKTPAGLTANPGISGVHHETR